MCHVTKCVTLSSLSTATPCQLHCKPVKRFFSVMLKDMVVDGTPCRSSGRDMCISGRCRVSWSSVLSYVLNLPQLALLHVTCYLLPVTCYLLHVTCYMLHVTCYMLPVTCYMLHVTCYMLHVTCYMLHVTCYMLHVTCYMLHVTRPLAALYCVMHLLCFCYFNVEHVNSSSKNQQLCKCV